MFANWRGRSDCIMFTCRCLNFYIESSGGLQPAEPMVTKDLTARAQELELVRVKYDKMVKKVDVLVGMDENSQWTEFHCKYCDTWVYACPATSSPSPIRKIIVAKSNMITSLEIERRKADVKYSPIFQIILHKESKEDIMSGSMPPTEPLHLVATKWLHQQTEAAKERIREFSDQQYAELDRKKMRAHAEQLAILKFLAPPEEPRKLKLLQARGSLPDTSKPSGSSGRRASEKKAETEPPSDLQDLEQEFILLEPMRSTQDFPSTPEGSDEEIVEVPPPRRRSEPLILARSLPIPVPNFMDDRRHDDRHEKSPQTPSDIAANIRALARSVHGEPIFGELPRRRFTKD